MWRQLFSELTPILKSRISWVAASIVDTLFLILWALLQYGISRLLQRIELNPFEHIVFLVFQVLFALSTLIVPIIYIIKDARIMYIRAKAEICRAEQGGGE